MRSSLPRWKGALKKTNRENRTFGVFPVLFLIPFSVYLLTLCPSFMDDDSPETIAAGWTLGIQHPPGYPLDSLLTRLSSLLPLGSPCWRINLFSCLLAALAVVLAAAAMGLFLEKQIPPTASLPASGRGFCAVLGSLLLAFSKTFWEKALSAKGGLYLIDEVILFAFLYCLLKTAGGPRRWLYGTFFAIGLGLTNHWQIQLLFLPCLAVLALAPGQKFIWKIPALKTLFLALAFVALGLSVLLYLPLRAHLEPVINLGAPDSFHRFLDALSRKYYADRERGAAQLFLQWLSGGASFSQFTGTLKASLDLQGRWVSTHLIADMGWPCLLLALAGLWMEGIRRPRKRGGESRWLGVVVLPFLLMLLALYLIPPLPGSEWRLDNFLLPVNGLTAVLAAMGLYGLLGQGLSAPWRRILPWAVWILPLWLVLANFRPLDEEKQTLRYDYGANLLKSLPSRSLFFAEEDEDYFPLYYFQQVERRRPDVKMIPCFILFESWGVEQTEKIHPELGLTVPNARSDPFSRITGALTQIVSKNSGRFPLGFSYFNGAFHRYYLSFHPSLLFRKSGILYLFDSPLSRKSPNLALSGLRLRHWDDCPSNRHPSLNGIWEVYGSAGLFNPFNP
jgi:hypothetical protein